MLVRVQLQDIEHAVRMVIVRGVLEIVTVIIFVTSMVIVVMTNWISVQLRLGLILALVLMLAIQHAALMKDLIARENRPTASVMLNVETTETAVMILF